MAERFCQEDVLQVDTNLLFLTKEEQSNLTNIIPVFQLRFLAL